MPFTVAHAVVAPPLGRLSGGRLAVTALAIGSMSPDFEYVMFLETARTFGHTLAGLFVFCLPVSLVALVLWHAVVKRPLAGLLPDRWSHLGAALCRPLPPLSAASAFTTVAAILVGAWTHIAWDSFTHPQGSMVQAIPVLRRTVAAGLPAYKVLQYGSGLVGMALLGAFAFAWAGRQPPVPIVQAPVRRRVVGAAWVAACTVSVALANAARVAGTGAGREQALVAASLGAMAGAAVGVVVYGLSHAGRSRALAEAMRQA